MSDTADGSPLPITEAIGEFVAALEYHQLPEDAIDLAERSFVDTVAVIVAGLDEAETATVQALAPGRNDALFGEEVDPELAFVNGVAGHCLDFDDCWEKHAVHPSVTMVPALLACATDDATGADLLTAYVAGFETQCFVAARLMPDHYEAGWHATATLGTFGTAAAVANLFGLDGPEVHHALNIAASLPGGLKSNFGTTTKSIHAGNAARAGITAAIAARNGATADPHAVDGQRGFVELYDGPRDQSTAITPDADELQLLETGIQLKKFPCCNYTHTSIEAALALHHDAGVEPNAIREVTVRVSDGAIETVVHSDPQTALEAKFSFEYTVAAALATGSVTLETFTRDAIHDDDVQSVRERVRVHEDPDLDYGSLASTVTVTTESGERVSQGFETPPGTTDEPLSEAELREKFTSCVTPRLDTEVAEQVFADLRSLREWDSLESIRSIV